MIRVVRSRRGLLVLGALLAAVASILARSSVEAQARAVVVIASVQDIPVVTPVAAHVAGDPREVETRIAGAPASLLVPDDPRGSPVVVLVGGAMQLGRREMHIRGLAAGLARVGFVVVVPDLPGLREGRITTETVRATVDVTAAASGGGFGRRGKVALVGISTGGTLALLAAEQADLADRLSVVAALGAFTEVRSTLRLATTETYRRGGRLVPFRPRPFLALAGARSLVAALPAGRDRTRLLSLLRTVDASSARPLAPMEAMERSRLGPAARAVVSLLLNRNPSKFDALFARLPAAVRRACSELSPVSAAGRLRAPVLLAVGTNDYYFPESQAVALARAAPAGTVDVTETIVHGSSTSLPQSIVELGRLELYVARALRLAAD